MAINGHETRGCYIGAVHDHTEGLFYSCGGTGTTQHVHDTEDYLRGGTGTTQHVHDTENCLRGGTGTAQHVHDTENCLRGGTGTTQHVHDTENHLCGGTGTSKHGTTSSVVGVAALELWHHHRHHPRSIQTFFYTTFNCKFNAYLFRGKPRSCTPARRS